jgi:hypothetical protein
MSMFLRLSRLRRSNRGQSLVLFALSVLVLALVTVTTLNVSETVYQKMQLQNAADNLAYSSAVAEARAYNVVSYINRAMVLHYSAMMTFAAYLSHAQYLDWAIMPILSGVAAVLEFFGIPGCTVVRVMRYWYALLDGHNAAGASPPLSEVDFCPPPTYGGHGGVELALAYLGAANELLYLVQEATLVWAGLFILNGQSFARKTDPLAEVPSLANNLSSAHSLPEPLQSAANPLVVENLLSIYSPTEHTDRSVGGGSYIGLPDRQNGQPVYPDYRGTGLAADEYARFLMMEIANASRDQWTAGQQNGPILIGRRWTFDLGQSLLGSGFACGTWNAALVKIASLLAGPVALLGMFFGMRLEKTAETRLRGFEDSLDSDQIWSDERLIVKDTVAKKKKNGLCCGFHCTCKVFCCPDANSCINWACLNANVSCDQISQIDLAITLDNGGPDAPTPGLFQPAPLSGAAEAGGGHQIEGGVKLNFLGMGGLSVGPFHIDDGHPLHYFKGVTPYVLSKPDVNWPQANHFDQPCNVALLGKNLPGRVFTRKWQWGDTALDYRTHQGLYTAGNVMGAYDMTAMAVGRAYYHRPGAWQEPPNFFNPLWHARLAPVREHWEFAQLCSGLGAWFPPDWTAAVCGSSFLGGASAAEVVIH